jgi:hypothetical protein
MVGTLTFITRLTLRCSSYELHGLSYRLVDRERVVRTVAVYTGNPEDKVDIELAV